MTLTIEDYGDVKRLRMSSLGSRLAGLDVSAYVMGGVMVDTGFHRVREEIAQAVTTLHVHGVIVTHWHEDHAGNVPLIARAGIPLQMRQDTNATLRQLPDIQLYRRLVWGYPDTFSADVEPFATPDIECIHTPGHSPDHQVVWHADSRTLFSGDLWLGVRSRVFHSAEDPFEIVLSLRRAAALSPTRMFDAHRGAVESPVRALHARADWLDETIAKITRLIDDGVTDSAIVKQVLGGEERSAIVSRGEYARANLVRAVRRRVFGGGS